MITEKTTDTSEIIPERLVDIHRYWQASNYLAAAQLYLQDNVLLQRPLQPSDIKARLLGHWGTVPGLNLMYVHLNRLIRDTEASVLLVVGPGHGAPAILAHLYLEGSLTEHDPAYSADYEGVNALVRAFSWPYGLPSHLFSGTPGQIHEGGELGYSLSHAFGAALDNPDLLVACVVGDGEAETGPLATSWHSVKFLNPATDGAVLPILHLNGYKISGPTILGRMTHDELAHLFTGYGYQVRFVVGNDPEPENVHPALWEAMDWAYQEIRNIQQEARQGASDTAPQWPIIILQTPKGWTGPEEVDGVSIENTFRAHQIPVEDVKEKETHLQKLENWLKSYQPGDLFDGQGQPGEWAQHICPKGDLRMGMNPHANGGQQLTPLKLPEYTDYAVEVATPGEAGAKGTQVLGTYFRDIFQANAQAQNFRIVCPDEIDSNKLQDVFEVTGRDWQEPILETDEHLARDGRVMEILSEHTCEGWLEGYLLTGRHGVFACYEAFIPIVDSMLNQYAKWLKMSKEVPWRKPIASLNYLLTSHVWRQDHNGYSHQAPSFMNNLVTKKNSVARIYLPPDANCLLSVADHCLRSRDYINLIVANKASQPQWLDMRSAQEHCKKGASVWEWAGTVSGDEPEIVLAAAGDVPTIEAVRAAQLIREKAPELNVQVVNVVDLFAIMAPEDHPHGLQAAPFDHLFTHDGHVIFAFHGYPNLIHELVHHRPEPERFHVRGYIEEGSTTTPFDMLVLNRLSRFHLVLDVLKYTVKASRELDLLAEYCEGRLAEHATYIREHGQDMPDIMEDMSV
ncbi:MAG: phosphoketolase family protein [Cyclobacteriaceae bacterium]